MGCHRPNSWAPRLILSALLLSICFTQASTVPKKDNRLFETILKEPQFNQKASTHGLMVFDPKDKISLGNRRYTGGLRDVDSAPGDFGGLGGAGFLEMRGLVEGETVLKARGSKKPVDTTANTQPG